MQLAKYILMTESACHNRTCFCSIQKGIRVISFSHSKKKLFKTVIEILFKHSICLQIITSSLQIITLGIDSFLRISLQISSYHNTNFIFLPCLAISVQKET